MRERLKLKIKESENESLSVLAYLIKNMKKYHNQVKMRVLRKVLVKNNDLNELYWGELKWFK